VPDAPVTLIVGATGATGSALTRRLRQAGGTVVVAARDADAVAALAEETGADGRPVDARDVDAVQDLVDAVVADHGTLDGAANLAGSVLIKPAHTTSADEFADVIERNLTTAFALVRAAAPAMRKRGGAIVLAASAAAQTGIANHEAIAAAKGGVIGLTRAAAATYGPRGVRVNAVAPGLVDAAMTATIVGDARQAEASRAMHVLGRLGTGDDVAAAVAFLLDPANDWITGQVLGVDGGLGQVRPRQKA
jgi:NAD(P)-dependent dehydrogenase (short-subunit alcohol dehydrogenase family)